MSARHRLDLDAAADPVPALAGRDPRRASWCCASADEPRIVGHAVGTTPIFNWLLWGYGIPAAVVLGRQHLPAPRRRRCAAAHGGDRRPSCSRCCWRSWKSATPSTVATSIARAPASPRLRCRSAWRWRWRSGWSGCASALGSVVHNAGAILLTVFAGLAARVRADGAGEPGLSGRSTSAAPSSTCCCSAMPCPPCSRCCCCPMRWRAGVRSATPTRSRQARSFSRSLT